MESMNKFFTTGEFAKICHVKKQTLFHYDEIGLLRPEVKKENGYRYYSYQQYEVFIVIELLKDLNMPLKDIRNFLSNKTPEQAVQLLQNQLTQIDNKIQKLNHTKKIVKTKMENIQNALNVEIEGIRIENVKESVLLISNNILNATDKEYLNAVSDFIDLCNRNELYTGHPIGAILSKEEMKKNQFDNYSYLYTMMPEDYFSPSTIVQPAGTYVIGFHKGDDANIATSYIRIFDFMKEHHLVMKDFSYEEFIFDEISVNGEENYVTKIMIQVETKED
ncbi:MerR family transcriptional regulator [Rummeliibacillus pycnus]|uniref:MerR family transcriptional regulator n=1 Tax=Rummeliibacillus pycnus TaxID=101070 RepID=UPI000C9A4A0C|nr:MerR family transcriptional regulator [Rummeliibacillus pycnus]